MALKKLVAMAAAIILAAGTAGAQTLLFHSGFEADVSVKPHEWLPDLIGVDRSVSAPNDWQAGLERDGRKFFFNFCNRVTPEQMGVELVNDPAGGQNRVLRMYQRDVPLGNNPSNKTRVQAEMQIDAPDRLREFYQQWRLYIHPDIRMLENFPESRKEGPQLMELDCADAGCGRYRITITLRVQGGGKPLLWNTWCHTLCSPRETFWQVISDAPVPYGVWVTVRMHWKSNAGTKTGGRFHFSYQPDGASRVVVADVKDDWVSWPQATAWGIRAWKPFVWYNAGQDETHYIRDNGGLAQIFVDDFELWDGWPGDGATTASVPAKASGPAASSRAAAALVDLRGRRVVTAGSGRAAALACAGAGPRWYVINERITHH